MTRGKREEERGELQKGRKVHTIVNYSRKHRTTTPSHLIPSFTFANSFSSSSMCCCPPASLRVCLICAPRPCAALYAALRKMYAPHHPLHSSIFLLVLISFTFQLLIYWFYSASIHIHFAAYLITNIASSKALLGMRNQKRKRKIMLESLLCQKMKKRSSCKRKETRRKRAFCRRA